MKKIISVLIVFILILSVCNFVNAYSTSKYSVDVPSTFTEVMEGSFTSNDGANFNVQITSYAGSETDPFTISNLNDLVNGLKNQIGKLNSTIKFKNLEIKEITTVTKNNYKCFHIQYTYELAGSEYWCEQYSLLSGKDIFTLTSTASTTIKLHSSEMKGIVDSFTVTNYQGKTGTSSPSSLIGGNTTSSSSNSLLRNNTNSSSNSSLFKNNTNTSSSNSSLFGNSSNSSSNSLFGNSDSNGSSSTYGSSNKSDALDVFKDNKVGEKKEGFDLFADEFFRNTLIGAGVGALVGLILYFINRSNRKVGKTNTTANTNTSSNTSNMNNNVNNYDINNKVEPYVNNNVNTEVNNNINTNVNDNNVDNNVNNNMNNEINNTPENNNVNNENDTINNTNNDDNNMNN